MKIYKYPLAIAERQSLKLPVGAKILDVQMQAEEPQLWALVDTAQPIEFRTIRIFGTGHDIAGSLAYIATFQQGRFVWHVFEERAL